MFRGDHNGMNMKLRMNLGLHQRQSLVMTQRLQQALKLLQIPTLELEQVLRQELQVNPLLEEVELDEDEPLTHEDSGPDKDTEADPQDTGDKVDWDEYFADGFKDGTWEREHEDDDKPERLPVAKPSGSEDLMSQLALMINDPLQRKIGEYIIGSLGDDGYLTSPLSEIAAYFEVDEEQVEVVLAKVQELEPSGVAARDLAECLLLQLRSLGQEDSPEAEIIKHHFDALKNRKFADIAREMGVSPQEVQEIAGRIGELDPKPGMSTETDGAAYITPDLVVEKVDEDYVCYLNDINIPRLRISNAYDEVKARSQGTEDDAAQFIDEKRRYAEWIIKTIEQRRRTMIKVMEAIVVEQREFFEHGAIALRPLTLQVIATEIGMHESTVSRVTRQKYVQTPRGVFPLKYFFSAGLDSDDGEEIAARAVKEMILKIVKDEDTARPLSDKKIADMLAVSGLKIARRTVAKYREQLGIMNARMRKQF
jgi:RNA polymerase sigma-54 factor